MAKKQILIYAILMLVFLGGGFVLYFLYYQSRTVVGDSSLVQQNDQSLNETIFEEKKLELYYSGDSCDDIRMVEGETEDDTISLSYNGFAENDHGEVDFETEVLPDIGGIDFRITELESSERDRNEIKYKIFVDGRMHGSYSIIITAKSGDLVSNTERIDIYVLKSEVADEDEVPLACVFFPDQTKIQPSLPVDINFSLSIYGGPDLTPYKVELYEVDERGSKLGHLGQLTDRESQNQYSGTYQITIKERGTKLFRAIALYEGLDYPVYSPIQKIGTTGIPDQIVKIESEILDDPATGEKFTSNEVLVSFYEGVSDDRKKEIVGDVGAEIVGAILDINLYQVHIPNGNSVSEINHIIDELKKYPEVESASTNNIIEDWLD